ncbi:MAG: hypothetical protein EP315_00425 [Gammaproteobacteria bacterium]|nr:MAG: hypothetical protein EP315_00425 [Gammaproteobacteria bacterium]
MSGVPAWVLQVDRVARVAVGRMEIIHVVHEPEFIQVPCAPEHCNRIILWNNKIIPVMNLSSWFNNGVVYYHSNLVAIAIYADSQTGELAYGGIQLLEPPVLDHVSNTQACTDIMMQAKWQALAVSCYRNSRDETVPILDLTAVFAQPATITSQPGLLS